MCAPTVLGVATPYHPSFYLPLALLHLSLLVRLVGDAMGMFEWMRIDAALNALALLAFILSTVSAVVRGKISQAASATERWAPQPSPSSRFNVHVRRVHQQRTLFTSSFAGFGGHARDEPLLSISVKLI